MVSTEPRTILSPCTLRLAEDCTPVRVVLLCPTPEQERQYAQPRPCPACWAANVLHVVECGR